MKRKVASKVREGLQVKGPWGGHLDRRTFNKALLGAGLALGTGGLFASCARSSGGGGSGARPTEKKTFHIDLSDLPDGQRCVLHAGGARYEFAPHTEETRAAAQAENPELDVARLTHHVPEASVSAAGPQRLHVTSHGPRGDGLVAVALHIPTQARASARRRAGRPDTGRAAADDVYSPCTMYADYLYQVIDPMDTAKTLVFHHPEIMSLDPTTAALVDQHLESSAGVLNLAISICEQGTAWIAGSSYVGWCVLVPMTNEDGSPRLDQRGDRMYAYELTDQTLADTRDAVLEVLQAVKDDPDLSGSQYTVRYGTSLVDQTDAAAARAAATGSGTTWTSSRPGYHHNIYFGVPEAVAGNPRSFTINILNMNFIHYGLYVKYLDPDGNAVLQESDSILGMALSGYGLESDTIKYQGLVSPPGLMLGIPLFPIPQNFTVTLPDGASAVELRLSGPGVGGDYEYWPSLLIGIFVTVLFEFGLPTFSLLSGLGEEDDTQLKQMILDDPSVLVSIIEAFHGIVSEIFSPGDANALSMASSLAGLLSSIVEAAVEILANGKIPMLTEQLALMIAEEESEESVPFLGWSLRILLCASAAADMVVTTAEILSNPLVISTTVRAAHDVNVVISHDPEDYQFPETATHFDVVIHTGAAAFKKTLGLTPSLRSQDQIEVAMTIPATGDTARVDVVFYAGNQWVAAHSAVEDASGVWQPSSVAFTNDVPSSGQLQIPLTCKENPVPITAQTVYSHHRKLTRSGGTYAWEETSTAPAPSALSCGTGEELCELGNLSLWVPGGMLGYSWRASSATVHEWGGAGAGQLYTFQNVSLKNDPSEGFAFPGVGYQAPAPVAYDRDDADRHFYLDPVDIRLETPEYHLRTLVLDGTTPVDISRAESWGRFSMPLDRLAVHPAGYVVGISTANSKLAVLSLPRAPSPSAQQRNNAVITLGEGVNSDRSVFMPRALTISRVGAILLLEGRDTKRVKAFNVDGSPRQVFQGRTSSRFDLVEEQEDVTWLDICVDPTDLLYVLSHVGNGSTESDYRLDIYDPDGNHIVRNTGISVARMTVDPWRNLYSLNYETVAGAAKVEPSASVWIPSTP